jgi:YkoY family integral membrane protein
MTELLRQIADHPFNSLLIVLNLVVVESLLSVDNAAVLATMVLGLPQADRKKALRYGLLGAYVFRGAAMAFAVILIHFWWLKPLGGIYLLYIALAHFSGKKGGDAKPGPAQAAQQRGFWATVVMVEVMDMAFSIDNVFAAVAFTPNIVLVCTGVFLGILAVRFVAGAFIKLMESYPFLETCAHLVIAILGLKLALSYIESRWPQSGMAEVLRDPKTDMATSLLTLAVMLVPVATSRLWGVPRKK